MANPAASDNSRAIGYWLLACAAMVFVMVMLGGATRLTESGLSMVQWKPLTVLPPPNLQIVVVAETQVQEARALLNGHLEAAPRTSGSFRDRYFVSDLEHLRASIKEDEALIVTIDLDYFASLSVAEQAGAFQRVWNFVTEQRNLRAITFAISRPYLSDDAEANRLVDVAVKVVNVGGDGGRKAWTYIDRYAGDGVMAGKRSRGDYPARKISPENFSPSKPVLDRLERIESRIAAGEARPSHSESIAELAGRIHQYTMLCASHVSQAAAVEALRNGEDDVRLMVADYDRRRRVFVKGLREIGLDCPEPGGAFYAFPSIAGTGLSSQEFAERLLHDEHVAVVPGDVFGPSGEGHIRCCYATAMPQLEEALARMDRFLRKL